MAIHAKVAGSRKVLALPRDMDNERIERRKALLNATTMKPFHECSYEVRLATEV